MGRYKFPGKPMKHVNKKRVNVLSCPSTKTNETSIDCNDSVNEFDICNSDWDSNKRAKISGLDMQETLHGKHTNSGEYNAKTDELKCLSLSSNSVLENKISDTERLPVIKRANKPSTFLYKNYHLKHDNLKSTRKRYIKKELRISNIDVHESVTKKMPSCNPRRSLYRRKKQIKEKVLASRMLERDSTNLVGKFVLPSKSLHSSRVIIPNKRFIHNEQVHVSKNEVDNVSKSSRKSKTDKAVEMNKRVGSPSCRKKPSDETKSAVNNKLVCNQNTSEFCLPMGPENPYSHENSRDSSEVVVIDSTGNTSAPKSCSKLVLRKARLQLRTHVSEDMDGPFSSYSASAPNPPGTVTCGVCGAVRFYRFVKQARKFNIYSCESCRKFISKMIKRQSCSITTLVCHKGQGMCHVPPIVRSQQWKLLRCAYKARCPACWLKMCLQSFQMPSQLKLNLTNMLPENMRISDDCNKFDIVPDLNKLQNSQETRNMDTNDASQDKLGEQTGKGLEVSISPVKLNILSSKTDTLLKGVESKTRLYKPRTRVATQKQSTLINKESVNATPDCTKRQKIDLKGPRVKHVCRSASIVLGQPAATFSRGCHSDDTEKNRSPCEASSETDACINCTSILENDYKNVTEERYTVNNKRFPAKQPNSISSGSAYNCCSANSFDFTEEADDDDKDVLKPVITISADYFDNYDSENKIYNNGFGLIGSEPFAIQAVCFYCGSAGQEQLLFCACCCEPYHFYCINDSVIHRYLHNNYNTQFNVDSKTNSSLNSLWKCSRCSICYKCGKSDKPKTTCQLCHRHFHSECMQSDWENSTKQTVCSLCLRCEDCGSQNVTSLVSNLFVCLPCFKIRLQEKCCVLCQTYDENLNSKFVKCGSCLNIVHAECEKLTDEMYNIIHHLPLSSTYLCSTCSFEKNSSWKDNVHRALKYGFHIILRLFSRNPSARNTLKLNLSKNSNCSCGSNNTFKHFACFNPKNNGQNSENEFASAVLQETASESSADESQNSIHKNIDYVKYRKDNNFDISYKTIRKKFCIKECSVRVKNCLESKKKYISNNIVNNECDKNSLKNFESKISMASCKLDTETIKRHCNKHEVLPIFLLLNIKRKINANIYKTVEEFHSEVQQVLINSFCHDLLNILDGAIRDTFPWYDPQSTLVDLENNICKKTVANISNKSNTLGCENTLSFRSQTVSALLKETEEKTESNNCAKENTIDTRICVLCRKVGDGIVSLEGRLLYCGQDEWIHINCAFWSTQVYEELDCSLQNVHEVIFNRRKNLCFLCKENGASVSCSFQRCNKIYHYMCARIANCIFLLNKTIYCSTHHDSATQRTNIISLEEFEMQRPIYIQVNMKKNKVELSKVQYLIGCLNVTNLGTFFSPLSDTEEAIIPSEFVCSRLFWSTTEPWKIVRYTINTSILIPPLKDMKETENNFTVDHSFPNESVAQKVETSNLNKFDYGKYKNKTSNSKEYENESMNITDDDKIVLQVLENLLELICSKEVEENCDDEPQNTADILPPELKDAIFEDLPHDLLDGISVQDIFPKLMSYEDIITADLKLTDSMDSGESIKSYSSNNSFNNDLPQMKSRKSDLLVSNDLFLEPKYSIHNMEEYPQTGKDVHEQHLKRSKSEIFTGIKKISRACGHQRSCSLTWSCKLDNSRPLSTKMRKLSCTSKSVADISNNLFMLVDGNNEKNSMLQELRLSDSILMSVGHSANVDCLSDSVRELKYCLEENQEIEHEKENNCRAWRNKSQSRIVQLDGADDSSSASDNESCNERITSPRLINLNKSADEPVQCIKSLSRILQLDGADDSSSASDNESCSERATGPRLNNLNKSTDEPVQCDKCQCTYRTLNSYKRHLTVCASMSSSESDSEIDEPSPTDNTSQNNHHNSNEIIDTTQNVTSNLVDSQSSASTAVINNGVDTKHLDIMTVTDNNYVQPCSQSVYIPSSNEETIMIQEIPMNTDCKKDLENVHVVENKQIFTQISNLQGTSNELSSLASFVEKSSQKLPIVKMSSVKKVIKQRNSVKPKTSSVAVRNKKLPLPGKRTRIEKTNFNAAQTINTNRSFRLPEVQNNGLGPTIIIQHLSSPNLMPTYVDAFQQQTGQNLQCIATIVPNEYKTSPFITPNAYMPGGFQIQSESPNLVSIPTEGLSMIPGLDTSRPMLSPFVHQNRPMSNFHCGMVSTEQLFVGSVPTLDPVVSDLHNSLYLSPPPLYYGFEAIVQNTVMSSQQFVSSTLPGVLSSNSSYSATTTQVFQSSKLEPIVDMNGTSYYVVNSTVPQVPPAPIAVNSHPLITTFQKPNVLSSHPQQPVVENSNPTTYPVQIVPVNDQFIPVMKPVMIEPIQTTVEPIIPPVKSDLNPAIAINKASSLEITTSTAANDILSYDNENKILMNVVTPTVQVSSASQVLKPTNRVLPMQTQPPKSHLVNNKVVAVEPPNILNKLSQTVDKIQETLQNDVKSLQKLNANKNQLLKLESASLKLVFQKQSEDGIYKISNKYVSKKKVPIKIAPVKKSKVQVTENEVNVKSNRIKEQIEAQNPNKNYLPKPDYSPSLLYKMQSQDGFDAQSTSLPELWKNVFNAVQSARAAHKMPLLTEDAYNVFSGLQLLGLNSNGLKYLIEQLPGVGNCTRYRPIIPKSMKPSENEESRENKIFSAARCDLFAYDKQPYDMFSWLASEHRSLDYVHQTDYDAFRRASSINLPMAMRFRQLKETSKQTVGVYRSGIHGRGLFCLRDIECGEMVVEYAGEVIRSTLTDKREKYYNSKGIGCYMFRVDDNFVIDATMKGNAARFINHSCDPNCYSRVLEILGHKHILIFALRKIIQGEELTYDYKFPFEEDKIPCTCGAKRCRKYLN